MDRNYWRDYWDNYYNFMAVYLNELQKAYPQQDLTEEYVEVANMFAPPMEYDNYEDYLESYEDYFNEDDYYYADHQKPDAKISPGGGQFTIDNCKKMALVKVEMKKNYKPSKFYMLVDRYDKKSIQGYRIACDDNRINFKAMAIDYKDISLIECVF